MRVFVADMLTLLVFDTTELTLTEAVSLLGDENCSRVHKRKRRRDILVKIVRYPDSHTIHTHTHTHTHTQVLVNANTERVRFLDVCF